MTDLASVAKEIAEPVARELWGDPAPGHSKPGVELRWGSGGSRSLNVKTGTWFDHEAGEGGGVLDLVKRETGTDNAGAVAWLKERRYIADEPREERAPPARRESGSGKPQRELVATYDYTDAEGRLLYQVCRYRLDNGKKTFAQRRPDGRGGWIWNLDGIGHTLYRLPKVAEAIADDAVLVLCYSPDTEVLTPDGWVRFDRLAPGVAVAQADPQTSSINFAVPTAHQRFKYQGEMINLASAWCDLLVTPDHRQPAFMKQADGSWSFRVMSAAATRKSYRLPCSGFAGDDVEGGPTADEARLLAAWLADGVWEPRGFQVSWNLKKDRKKDRLRGLLDRLNVPFTVHEYASTPGWTSFRVRKADVEWLWKVAPKKVWPWSCLQWSRAAIEAAAEEVGFWDGDRTGISGSRFFTSERQSAEVVSALAALSGRSSILRVDRREGRNDSYIVSMKEATARSAGGCAVYPRVWYEGDVYCCTVPTSFLLVRRNGKVAISGNCEGEKDVETLEAWGVPATTNSGGAKHWSADHARLLAGADVVIIPDNDDAGRQGAQIKAQALHGVARCVRVLDLAKEVPALEPKGDVTDWRDRHGGTVDALYDMIDRAPVWSPTAERLSRLKPVTWDRIDAKGEAHEWLVKGLLTRGELSMLAGPSQSGKSFLAIDLSCAIARGVPWFGRKVRQGGVVYQAGESAKGVRRKRLPAYRKHTRSAEEAVPFALLQAPINLHASDDDTQAMIDECLFWKESWGSLELVVIDTFSAATPGANENASEDMSRVLSRCGRIAEATGAAVLLVHHMNALGEKPRGHTSIFANLDSVLLCRKDAERRDADNRQIREMRVAKAKDGEADWSLRFVLPAVEIGRDEDGDPITSCVVAEPNMGLLNEPPPDAKPARLSDKPFNYLKAIKAALDEHGITAGEAKVELPVGTMVVHRKHVAEAYAATWQGEEDDPVKRDQNQRAARMRLGEKLLAGGYIGSASPWLWLLSRGEAAVTPRRRNVTGDGGGVTPNSDGVTSDTDPVTGDDLSDLPEFAR